MRKSSNIKTIQYHKHGGYYGDGNSHYYSTDHEVNLETMKVKRHYKETFGGQLISVHGRENIENSEWDAIPFDKETENKIYETLKPLIEVSEKYPHREDFRFFSQKHKYFIKGRIDKAIKIAIESKSDFYGYNCGRHIFILKRYNIVIGVLYEDTRNHKYWKVNVEKIK